MKKKYIVIMAILTVLAVAVSIGVHNHRLESYKTEQSLEEEKIVLIAPQEEEGEVQKESPVEMSEETTDISLDEEIVNDGNPEEKPAEEKPAEEKPEEEKPAEENVVQPPNTSKVEAIPGQHRDPNNIVVVIDPGHQFRGDNNKEPNGPGSATMKARVTSGTTGVATGVAEYVLNLDISLKLKTELENRGYVVHMTRSTHDVNISNKERAEYANSVNADIAVRIHANGSSNASIRGVETYGPSASNPYVGHLSNASMSLSKCIVDAYAAATGFRNRGARTSDIMTGINWSSVPVTIVELGYMSNAEEDRAMQDATMQNNMIQGIANGIDAYFGL